MMLACVCVFVCLRVRPIQSWQRVFWVIGHEGNTHHKAYLQDRAPLTVRQRPECYLQSGAVNGLISLLVVCKCSVVWFENSVSVDVGLCISRHKCGTLIGNQLMDWLHVQYCHQAEELYLSVNVRVTKAS